MTPFNLLIESLLLINYPTALRDIYVLVVMSFLRFNYNTNRNSCVRVVGILFLLKGLMSCTVSMCMCVILMMVLSQRKHYSNYKHLSLKRRKNVTLHRRLFNFWQQCCLSIFKLSATLWIYQFYRLTSYFSD